MDRMRSSRTAQRVPRSASRSVRDLPPLRLPAVTIVESLSHDPGVVEGLSPDEWDDRVHFGAGLRQIGIGVSLAAAPSHTTVHTGPYTAVRWMKAPGAPRQRRA